MKRFRSHAFVVALIGVAVVIILLVHSIRVRLEWGTGGFILGLIAGGLVALDVRHHRKRRASASENPTSS
jgi:peptidoglycan/LPS O-acetylase OafA/YrhL